MEQNSGRFFSIYLVITAVISGALVMVVEVLGSRVIGPFFGVSLFVWTSLITVTLLALAGGYAIGGWLSDRRPSADYLYALIMAAGLLVLCVPLLKSPVLTASQPLGLRAGAFASTLVLFGPALLLLGCVSPYVIKLAAREFRHIGGTVGRYYAYSTIGSCLGTVLTGFVLIAYLGVTHIFLLTGMLLLLLGVVYFAVFRRRYAAAVVLLAPFLFAQDGQPVTATLPSGTRAELVADEDSFYGNLKIVDYRYGDNHTRELLIDGLIQGGIDLATGQSVYGYAYYLQYLPVALHPRGKRCLTIGLGAGVVPMWYERQGIATDVVDIDPAVVRLAREHFGFNISGSVYLEDARYFLQRTTNRYDYLLLDVFNGDTTPGHVLSHEAFDLMRARLTENGILAINLVASLRERNEMTAAIVRTLKDLFDQVRLFPAFDVEGGDGIGNIIVVAYQGAARQLRLPGQAIDAHPLVASQVRANLGREYRLQGTGAALRLTDDFNPIDVEESWLREDVRRQILSDTPWAVLLGR